MRTMCHWIGAGKGGHISSCRRACKTIGLGASRGCYQGLKLRKVAAQVIRGASRSTVLGSVATHPSARMLSSMRLICLL